MQSLYQNYKVTERIYRGLGRSPNRFPRRGKPTALGAEAGCDPTSLKLEGTHFSDLKIVCNVNNKPKFLLMERNRVGERFPNWQFIGEYK